MVVLSYVAAVALACVGLRAAFGTIGLIYAGFVAAIGLLVVALCAPSRGVAPDAPEVTEPVLRRPRAPRDDA